MKYPHDDVCFRLKHDQRDAEASNKDIDKKYALSVGYGEEMDAPDTCSV